MLTILVRNCLLGNNNHFLVIVELQITRNDKSLGDLYYLKYQKKLIIDK